MPCLDSNSLFKVMSFDKMSISTFFAFLTAVHKDLAWHNVFSHWVIMVIGIIEVKVIAVILAISNTE